MNGFYTFALVESPVGTLLSLLIRRDFQEALGKMELPAGRVERTIFLPYIGERGKILAFAEFRDKHVAPTPKDHPVVQAMVEVADQYDAPFLRVTYSQDGDDIRVVAGNSKGEVIVPFPGTVDIEGWKLFCALWFGEFREETLAMFRAIDGGAF